MKKEIHYYNHQEVMNLSNEEFKEECNLVCDKLNLLGFPNFFEWLFGGSSTRKLLENYKKQLFNDSADRVFGEGTSEANVHKL